MRKQGTLDICVSCNRLMKIAARGLCVTCYQKETRSHNLITCQRCGETKYHHSHGLCERCYSSKRHSDNHEKWLKDEKRRFLANPEKRREQDRKRNKTERRRTWQQAKNIRNYAANKESLKDYQKRYRAEHPGFTTHHTEKYKAKKAQLPHDLTEAQWQQILSENNHSCYYCGKTNVKLQREHKIPVSRGGGYTYSNIVPACRECNMRKHTMTDKEFFYFLRKFPNSEEG